MNIMTDAPAKEDQRSLHVMSNKACNLRDAVYAIQIMVQHPWDGVEADRARNALQWITNKMEDDADELNDQLDDLLHLQNTRTTGDQMNMAEDSEPSDPRPDLELVLLCEEFRVLEDKINATLGDIDDTNPSMKEQEQLIERMCEIRATTMEGHLARAKAMVAYKPYVVSRFNDFDDVLIGALLRDMVGEGVK